MKNEHVPRRYGESARAYVIRRDGMVCTYCGIAVRDDYGWDEYPPDKLSIDHAVPPARGGTNRPINMVVACLACNNAKGQMTDDEFRAWLVAFARRILGRHERTGDNPAAG